MTEWKIDTSWKKFWYVMAVIGGGINVFLIVLGLIIGVIEGLM